MQTTTITEPDSRSALNRVMDVLGPDAVIIQTRKTRGGVEVVAGVERRMPPIAPQALKPRHDPMVRFIAQARAVGVDPELLSAELAICGDDLAAVWSRFTLRVERELALAPLPHRDLAPLCVVGDSGSATTTTLDTLASMSHADVPPEPGAFPSAHRRLDAPDHRR